MKAPESKPTVRFSPLSASVLRNVIVAIVWLLGGASAFAQAMGTIEGRVSHPATGGYLETVRLIVEGTTLETFTDSDGNYRLPRVPAGNVKVKAFFTSLIPQKTEVVVSAGQVVRHDIQLGSSQKTPAENAAVVQLDEFVVSTTR